MILYTTMPYAEVFPEEPADVECVPIANGCVYGRNGVIDHIFSTDPADYLNPVFLPGEPVPDPENLRQSREPSVTA